MWWSDNVDREHMVYAVKRCTATSCLLSHTNNVAERCAFSPRDGLYWCTNEDVLFTVATPWMCYDLPSTHLSEWSVYLYQRCDHSWVTTIHNLKEQKVNKR